MKLARKGGKEEGMEAGKEGGKEGEHTMRERADFSFLIRCASSMMTYRHWIFSKADRS
jgi:hypothetical protein